MLHRLIIKSRLGAQLVAAFSRCLATSKLDENSIVDAKAT